jgi:hypothetical protein
MEENIEHNNISEDESEDVKDQLDQIESNNWEIFKFLYMSSLN